MLKYLPMKTGAKGATGKGEKLAILDVGCSNGAFGRNIKSHFAAEVWGVDINPAAIQEAAKVLDKAFCFDLATNLDQFEDEKFDVIYFNDVLEHMPDPYTLLSRVKNKLKKDGVIVASIPNIRFFRVLSDLLFNRDFRYQDDGVMDRTHLRFFTKKSIVRMFEEQDYKVDVIEPINKSKSMRPWFMYLLTLGLIGRDIFYPQFAVVAARADAIDSAQSIGANS